MSQLLIIVASLTGAAGVAAAAAAAHRGGDNLQTASIFLMVHAPVFLAVGLTNAAGNRAIGITAIALALGVALFCGDLVARDLFGQRLFPYAAPIGGSLTILTWLMFAVVTVMRRS